MHSRWIALLTRLLWSVEGGKDAQRDTDERLPRKTTQLPCKPLVNQLKHW